MNQKAKDSVEFLKGRRDFCLDVIEKEGFGDYELEKLYDPTKRPDVHIPAYIAAVAESVGRINYILHRFDSADPYDLVGPAYSLGVCFTKAAVLRHSRLLPAQFFDNPYVLDQIGLMDTDAFFKNIRGQVARTKGRRAQAKQKNAARNKMLCEVAQGLVDRRCSDAALTSSTLNEFDRRGYWKRYSWKPLSSRQTTEILRNGGVKKAKKT